MVELQNMPLRSFFNEFKDSLVAQVRNQITPVYDGGVEEEKYKEVLSFLKRKPYPTQSYAIEALMKLMYAQGHRCGILNGEMGTGKTMMAICIAYLLHRVGFKRTIVLCPPHLVYKWKREIEQTLPESQVVIMNGASAITTLNNIRHNLKHYGAKPTFFIVGRVRLRLGGDWQPAFMRRKLAFMTGEDGKLIREFETSVLCCANCGKPQEDNEGYLYAHDTDTVAKKRRKCVHCGSQCWQAGKQGEELDQYTKLLRALCQLPTIGKARARKILDLIDESLLVNSLEDNFHILINLMDEKGEFIFSDAQANRLERAIMRTEFTITESRYQVSEFIKRYFPTQYFGLLMCDEAHEYKNGDTAQGQAMGVVASQCKKVLYLTGTLMGGYANDVFHLLMRGMPSVMIEDGFKYSATGSSASSEMAFLETYGILKYTQSVKEGDSFKTAKGNNNKVSVTRAPGLSVKAVARYLLPYTAFVRLKDIDPEHLAPYIEHDPIMLEMEPELKSRYQRLSNILMSELRNALAKGDRTLLGTVLASLLSYSETAFLSMCVEHPRTEMPLVSVPAVFDTEASIKEQKIIDLCLKEKANDRKAIVYSTLTGKRDTQERLKALMESTGLKVFILKPSVKTDKREDWILDKLDRGIDVLLTNPKLVETGLDLLDFPTIIFNQTGYNVYTMMQAMRRSWRIGQTKAVDIYFVGYKSTAQAACLGLMAQKVKVSQSTSGEMPSSGLEMLNQSADNMEMAIAKKLIQADPIDDNPSLSLAFNETEEYTHG